MQKEVSLSEPGVGLRVGRIEIDRLLEQGHGLEHVPGASRGQADSRLDQLVVGGEVLGRRAVRFGGRAGHERRLERLDDLPGHIGLDREHVRRRELFVVGPGPQVIVRLGVDQLHGDPHPVARALHAALQHRGHSQLAPDLPDAEICILVAHDRSAGDQLEALEPRQLGEDVVVHSLGEELVLGIRAPVRERENRQGCLV